MGLALVYIHYYPVSLTLPSLPQISLPTHPSPVASSLQTATSVPSVSAAPQPSPSPKITMTTYDNHYFSLVYPNTWTQSIPSAPGTLTAWQVNSGVVNFEITVKKPSYTYESYQYHVSAITSHPNRDESFSSMTENKLNGVRTLSYTHTTIKGEYTEVTWFLSSGFEYMLTWSLSGSDATNRDLLLIQNQDAHDAIFHSLTLP